MDLTIHTSRPERERTCAACRWTWADEGEPGEHSCRTAPTTPRSTLREQARISASIRRDRELRIRRERLADLDRARG